MGTITWQIKWLRFCQYCHRILCATCYVPWLVLHLSSKSTCMLFAIVTQIWINTKSSCKCICIYNLQEQATFCAWQAYIFTFVTFFLGFQKLNSETLALLQHALNVCNMDWLIMKQFFNELACIELSEQHELKVHYYKTN